MLAHKTIENLEIPATKKKEASRRLAFASFMNGSTPEAEQEAAVEAAQHARVTVLDFLHERIEIESGLPTEEESIKNGLEYDGTGHA